MPCRDFFLDLFVFFSSQSKYFAEVSSTAFLTAYRLPAGFLLPRAAPFGAFLYSFLLFFEIEYLHVKCIWSHNTDKTNCTVVIFAEQLSSK